MASSSESDDEEIVLSSDALDALNAFYAERDARAKQLAELEQEAEQRRLESVALSMDTFTEDWNESQFWYSEETANQFAHYLLDGCTAETTLAIVSAPSVFVALRNILSTTPSDEPKPKLVLLEHDNRFAIFPEFVFYDFAQPFKLPPHLKGTVDCVITDPPFLSEDCQTKTALTVRWLLKTEPTTPAKATAVSGSQAGNSPAKLIPHPRIIVCTGERMEGLITKLYRAYGVRTTDFEPKHARGLSNEFYCYANFESELWKWRGEKAVAVAGDPDVKERVKPATDS
ncbi:putative N6-adenine methyltransferase-domain-containing protein [Lasiosphaeria miniovina]|uniref:Protein-lysine N-methyltransferase EFM5 n=1 Tax=Lasiosphaeria miniovina TaxID=1954250 RepID=A0AA40ADL0_9PEZI|nr:putative N6-adenine methyltransferase-domain-containing protein [Lasiosphaeria miniovina]KAK0713799.1 putative N6-adenine methyltransferase-domain-containing protein [Lasiosphaeria miniovina]